MPRLQDLKLIARSPGLWPFAKRVYAEISDDDVFMHASAMAYAWIFAVFPFVIFLLTLTPYVPRATQDAVQSFVEQTLSESLTPTAAATITGNVKDVLKEPQSGLLIVGLTLTLYAASGGMNMTMNAIDQAFDVIKPRRYITRRAVAMGLTIFMCLSVIVIVLMLPIGTELTKLFQKYSDRLPPAIGDLMTGPSLSLLTIARYVIGLTVMQILIGVVYHFGRSERNRLRFFTPGSVFVGLGWVATGFGMRIYVENFANYSKTYGTVAGMVIMLLIFYLNAVILLIGAEIDSEITAIKRGAVK